MDEINQLKQAIDTNDLDRVKSLMGRNPELHCAPLGYNKNGPLMRCCFQVAPVRTRAWSCCASERE
jgi:hypothetical protein